MMSVTFFECDTAPLVPVMVMVYVPGGVLPEVVISRREEPAPLTEEGENMALAPAGNPEALRVTVPVNPPIAERLTV